MASGDGAAHEGDAGVGAGLYHRVGLLQGVGYRLFGHDALGAVLDSEDGQRGAVLDVGWYGDDVEPLVSKHLHCVSVERLDAVALAEYLDPLAVAVRSGYEVDLGPVGQGLREGHGHARAPAVPLVVVEPAVHVQVRWRGAVDVVDVPDPHPPPNVVEHPHPP